MKKASSGSHNVSFDCETQIKKIFFMDFSNYFNIKKVFQ